MYRIKCVVRPIEIYFHRRLIIIVWHVYIIILYVLYDDVCMYKSSQIKCLFRSGLYKDTL